MVISRLWVSRLFSAAVVGLLVTSTHAVTTADISAAAPLVFGDMTTFNWRILNQVNPLIPIPATPSGNATGFIRMYTNGNTNNPTGIVDSIPFAPANVATYPDGTSGYTSAEKSLYWFGLEFGNGRTPTVDAVLTADDVLSFIQGFDPAAVNPIFGFDQNQEGSDPDLFLRGRLILVKGSVVLTGLSPADATTAVNDAFTNGDAVEFLLIDDPAAPNGPDALPGGSGYVYLPGTYDPDFDPIPGNGPFDPVDNNGAGNNADWGGYINLLDLTDYAGYSFLVEMEVTDNNNGKEEAYILGGLAGEPENPSGIPEPLTAATGVMGLAAMGMLLSRRRSMR